MKEIIFRLAEKNIHTRDLVGMQKARFEEVKRSITLPRMKGGEEQWEVADPSLLVQKSIEHSTEMEDAFATSLRWHPCSEEAPWRLIVTFDEFTPGNALKPQNARKTMVVNFSFQELEYYGDFTWWTMAVAKVNTLKTVEGGWSRMLRDVLRMALGRPSGMMAVGLPLAVKGKHVVINVKLTCLLSDGDGLRQALQWNGASSDKPCFRHWNVVRPGSVLDGSSARYVNMSCADPSRFQVWSEADLRISIDVTAEARRAWAAGEIYGVRLEEVTKALGFKATSDGLLADPQLRGLVNFMDVLRYDWAHTFLADSLVGREMWALIAAAQVHHVFTQQDVYDFLSEPWSYPQQRAEEVKGAKWSQLRRIFDDFRRESNEERSTVKASMSELLGLYSLMRHFVETRVPRRSPIEEDVRLFSLVCSMVDLLLLAKKKRLDVKEAGRQLLVRLQDYMERLSDARDTKPRPKMHWAFDIAECMASDGFLQDTFTLERLHLRVKHVADNCCNLGHYQSAVMRGVTNAHLNNMSHSSKSRWSSPYHLLGAVEPIRGAPHILVADSMRYFGEVYRLGSFIQRGDELGRIAACLQDESDCCLWVEVCARVSQISHHSSVWSLTSASTSVWRVEDVTNCLAWKVDGDQVTAITS